MKIGLLGLPNSGKTTIFNALTRSQAEVGAFGNNTAKPNVAVIEVGDERITRLTQLYHPKKTTYATIDIVDFAGFAEDSARKNDSFGMQMNLVRNLDAIALVIRNFGNDVTGSPMPVADIDTMVTEFILADMIVTEKRLDRIAWSARRGKKSNTMQMEEKVLHKILEELYRGQPIRDLTLNTNEQRLINGFQFLTQKPFFIILNSGENNFGNNPRLMAEIEEKYKVIEFAGNFEMELAAFSNTQEAGLFMEEMGIAESAHDRMTRFAYEVLDHISFITVGADEVRAWTLHNGDTALEAAATIHSDLCRGFIRAECFSYDDLMAFGSEKGIRDNGHFRVEGRNYKVKDGDILNILFSV
ncbi:MAG: redox-regulated ATPase YchF [Deltaproteobacteria bacterium]|nr:redox-regulated ATPase YchF [Deltaproteobacteria bacterium]MBW2321577.1 redox-regulated ATPase YchF [Deltaproteobacteria bacterium]